MTQDEKDQLKAKTGTIRVKLTDNSTELAAIISDPGDLENKINTRIVLINDLIHSLDLMDEYIDAQ